MRPGVKMDGMPDLAMLRQEIDALDNELRTRLLARAELVAKVAASKAQSGSGGALRPLREAQQMAALVDWQATEAPQLPRAGLLAIWREIIGMALAQQGGLSVYATEAAMAEARAHFGASLDYVLSDAKTALAACAENPRAVAVLAMAEAHAPVAPLAAFAVLPIINSSDDAAHKADMICYAQASDETADEAQALVRRAAPQEGDIVLGTLAEGVLVAAEKPSDDDEIWGQIIVPPVKVT